MTREELLEQKAILKQELTDINGTISAIIKRKNKEYDYSNMESTHRAKTHTLKELREMRDSILDDIADINRQLGCTAIFTQMKS